MPHNLKTLKSIIRHVLLLVIFTFFSFYDVDSQENFFLDDWNPLTADSFERIPADSFSFVPESIINIDFAETAFKISPYLSGYNQPAFRTVSRRFYDQPELVRHIRNIKPQLIRYPGGTAAMSFFWDKSRFQLPLPDAPNYYRNGELMNNFGYGVSDNDIFTLDSYYHLLDSIESMSGIMVVNYGYARYGLSEDPVAKASKYAADWVRHDNGRTRFWEIGNELDGLWTPGHQIDISRNKDGQPEFLDGLTYARHFRVFVDSMRTAADETGAAIKIGAVLTHRSGSWNRQFLENASDVADFLIVHNYYGSEGENDDPMKLIEQAGNLATIKQELDEVVSNFSSRPLPIVLTEWNTRDVQTTGMCINGLSNIFALKNIIESGYSLACRHTLIQNIPRGLIHLYDPRHNEGLENWQPRATFFYYYYLQKFLGDTYYTSQVSGSEKLEVMASTFSSGQAGLVILNKSEHTQKLALNMRNFIIGPYYSWYTLSPENYDPYSSKVVVNGQTNQPYPGGGPLNYEELPAFTLPYNGVAKMEIPPYSVVYMMLDGYTEKADTSRELSFTIYGRKNDSVFFLKDAFISANTSCALTDINGNANFHLPDGEVHYRILKEGFFPHEGKLVISSDQNFSDTIQMRSLDLTFKIHSEADSMPLVNLPVSFADQHAFTTDTGEVTFEDMPVGTGVLSIETPGFLFNDKFDFQSDTIVYLYLKHRKHQVVLSVKDHHNFMAIPGALVEVDEMKTETGPQGNADFPLTYGDQVISVTKTGYHEKNVHVHIDKDTSIIVMLEASSAELRFRIYHHGMTPVNNVSVTVQGSTLLTNSLGICTFPDMDVGFQYDFHVSKNGYMDIDSSVFLATNTTVDIQLELSTSTSLYNKENELLNIFPNPLNHTLHLEASLPLLYVELFTMKGGVISKWICNGELVKSFDVSGIPKGTYIIRVKFQPPGNEAIKLVIIK